ncbi:hypothetical protein BHE74_00016535 [Ensete ventricosum]|uniref:Uncharacterized protein n=1 Tax=Ensete ventricosum TaxID=4639 RepID=A0A444EXD4_ENSVE|nr:hypothetical protein B296_00014527 [Ensete ventricosum]RWW15031.1 hypothetical protein GW17_00021146 [Ensete ventricosum]RWW75440.1 hypothetical protein BHE74_00016535 [Ensete ventricosum]RZR95877.1 hypothetical protein BHM03_00024769 [Ensete ventricosum]
MGNTSSMLTQYDIEELQEHCNHACDIAQAHSSSYTSFGSLLSTFSSQKVLTRVLEEAGYTKDSSLVLSDFMKVRKSNCQFFGTGNIVCYKFF